MFFFLMPAKNPEIVCVFFSPTKQEPNEPHFDAEAFDSLLQQGQSALEGEERRSAAETSPGPL